MPAAESPLPAVPALPPSIINVSQTEPIKRIFGEADIEAWVSSQAYYRITLFISRLAASVTGHSLLQPVPADPVGSVLLESESWGYPAHGSATCGSSLTVLRFKLLDRLVSILDTLESWIEEIPLRQDPQRFGNLAFRDWGQRLNESAEQLHQGILPDRCAAAVKPELLHHFKTAFGSFTRIDYGSGHELSFLAYLSLYYLSGLLQGPESEKALVCHVFLRYLRLCHQLQTTYRLEPAGSKGVWGLDDYKFTPYIFGAAQLLPPCRSPPPVKSILDVRDQSEPLAQENLLFLSVSQVHSIKRGPFSEHSPVLYNIATTVPNWSKVCTGLQKMYAKEVLEKWPVVQHLYFGACLPWKSQHTGQDLPSSLSQGSDSQDLEPATGPTGAPWAATTTETRSSNAQAKSAATASQTSMPLAATQVPGLEPGELGRL